MVYDYELGCKRSVLNNRLNRLLSALNACNPARLYADGKNFQQMWEQNERSDWSAWLLLILIERLARTGSHKELVATLDNIVRRRQYSPSKGELHIVYKAMLAVEKLEGTKDV